MKKALNPENSNLAKFSMVFCPELLKETLYLTHFNGFRISIKFCVFLYPYRFFEKKKILGSYGQFLKNVN